LWESLSVIGSLMEIPWVIDELSGLDDGAVLIVFWMLRLFPSPSFENTKCHVPGIHKYSTWPCESSFPIGRLCGWNQALTIHRIESELLILLCQSCKLVTARSMRQSNHRLVRGSTGSKLNQNIKADRMIHRNFGNLSSPWVASFLWESLKSNQWMIGSS
jgi:hypothetical protein